MNNCLSADFSLGVVAPQSNAPACSIVASSLAKNPLSNQSSTLRNPGSRFGVDIGGTTIKIGIVSNSNEVLEKQVFDTRPERSISEIVEEIALNINSMSKDEISYIGLGAPGFNNFPGSDKDS